MLRGKGKGKVGRAKRKVLAYTSKGQIEGEICYCNDTTKERYCSFKNIPYARPPLRHRRFAAPLDFNLFEQVDYKGGTSYEKTDKEDVLRLHIYTPMVRDKDSEETYTRPVIVFVPGQLNFRGLPSEVFYGPHFLLTKNVVLVVISYRQGFLGFTRFPHSLLDATGDAGFKDIIMAFRFVKNEIANFGGNPDNVTAYGHGIGAGYARAILIDPRYDNLFHKLILGSTMEHCINIEDATIFDGNTMAYVLSGQQTMSEDESVEYLRGLKYEEFKKKDEDPIFNVDTIRVVNKVKLNRFGLDNFDAKIPVMIGFNAQEGKIEAMLKPDFYHSEWQQLIAMNLLMMRTCPNFTACQEMAAIMAETYKSLLPDDAWPDFRELFVSDVNYIIETMAVTSHVARSISPSNVFLYRFAVDLDYNCTKKAYYRSDIPGTAHGDELGYIFKTPFTQNVRKNSLEAQTIERMTQMWYQFALKGDPNLDDPSMMDNFVWEPVQLPIKHCFNIYSRGVTYCELPELDRMVYWEKIFDFDLLGKTPLPLASVGKKGKKKRHRGKKGG